jgi:hypothetical protein
MTKMTDNEKAKAGIKARQDAIHWLIDAHRDAFDQRVADNRVALGLPARPAGDSPDQIAAKLKRAEDRADKLRAELARYA